MRTADVVVIGGGLIGLAVASDAAARGASVLVIGESRPGEASPAGAGMLAPGAESDELPGTATVRFAVRGRDLFPAYLAALRDDTGIDVPLDREGILELKVDGEPATRPATSEWLDAPALRAFEPALGNFAGAVLHPGDGSVDNVVLLRALRARAGAQPRIAMVAGRAREIAVAPGARPRVTLQDGDVVEGARLVLAAGAWASELAGLPRPLPVFPMRGQMLSLAGAPVHHVTYGAGGYVVPRADGRTLIGATMERVGYDNATTPGGRAQLEAVARDVSPALGGLPLLDHWAGLRPLTPDHLPLLGPDPDIPELLYACGHGRNGILLAPITGEAIGALSVGSASEYDLTPFAISRFVEGR